MKAAVVYESLFGHTREIAAGVTDAWPEAEVELVWVGEAERAHAWDAVLARDAAVPQR